MMRLYRKRKISTFLFNVWVEFCSMKITQDIRNYASKHNIKDIKIAVEKGMKESKEFAESGNKIYVKK